MRILLSVVVGLLLMVGVCSVDAQEAAGLKTRNVILVTVDGLRWQDLFTGADEALINDKAFVGKIDAIKERFWRDMPSERRQVLMPFFWGTLAKQGQIYGHRSFGSTVDLTNKHLFSYPGYSEILTGFADDERIDSNAKKPNPNVTILEFANQQFGFENRVAAFGSWDVFPFIVNAERSGVPVNAGFMEVDSFLNTPLSSVQRHINHTQMELPRIWDSVRYDTLTHQLAMEHLRLHHPRLLYIAYGETDDFAHHKEYDQYLIAAQRTDALIAELWAWVQSTEGYRDQTTLIITTDHGRGLGKQWHGHGKSRPESVETWIAAIGPDTAALGEVTSGQLYSNQIAATVTTLLGLDYKSEREAGKVIESIVGKK